MRDRTEWLRSPSGPELWIAAGFVLALAGCSQPDAGAPATPPPPAVAVAHPIEKEIVEWDEYMGRFEAVESVEVRARVGGYLEQVNFRDGAHVGKGDLLFVIDPRPYRAELARARGDLSQVRARLALAKTDLARAERLFARRVLSEEELDARRKNLREAGAAIQSAQAAMAMAKLNLDFTEVRAPIGGRISRRLVTKGNLINDGTGTATLLTTIVSLDPIYVYFEADEQAYLRYSAMARRGERPSSREVANPVHIGLADEPDFPHQGRMDFVDNQLDPATGTMRARAVLDNKDGVFTPGLFARVKLLGSGKRRALLIDDKAILTDQDRKFVYVLGSGNTAERRDVTLGRTVEGLRIITAGLAAADRVIVHGVQKIFLPGMPVSPQTIGMGDPPPLAPAQPAEGHESESPGVAADPST
jgi:multidrug efflux system membrane fusion protein